MGIHVIQSQRIEVLLQGVLQMTARTSSQPFQVLNTQHFVVPTAAVQQWLTQKISEQQGISANQHFHLGIRGFQWSVYQSVLEDKDKVRKANIPRLIMKWRIYQVLKSFIEPDQISLTTAHPLHSIVQRIYDSAALLEDPVALKLKKQSMLYWVSEQVSKLFSHYMLYRGYCLKGCGSNCSCPTNWLQAWGRNQALNIEHLFFKTNTEVSAFSLQQAEQLEAWQRWLWQESFAADFAEVQTIDTDFWQVMDDPAQRADVLGRLPAQLLVFTLLDLAPSQLQFLRRLGQYIDVTILHYNPSQEYWADSVDPNWKKQYDLGVKARFVAKHPKATDADIAQFFDDFNLNFNAEVRESRHPLLTRFGKQARDHFSLLSHLSAGEEGQWVDAFVDEFPAHLLGKLQSDILYLVEPEVHGYALDPQDDSIQIHVCHSSLRQLEVLKDQLLHWLSQSSAADPRRASDVLILVPDLKQIEPLIREVFPATANQVGVFLPVKIAGVTQLDVNLAWQAVVGRIKLSQGRFTVEEFSDWLQLPASQLRYGLDVDQSDRMLDLLVKAGFKRGLDAAHLQRSLSAEDQDYRFSFKFALDRLAMGLAIPVHQMFEQTLCYAELSRDDFALVGHLIQIYQDFSARSDWMIAHELGRNFAVDLWLKRLMQDLVEFEQAGVESLKHLREIIKKQERMLTLASFYDEHDQPTLQQFNLPLPYLLTEIENTLDSQLDQTLPTGQITFSQIGQIRPLPYKLMVMLNLDGGKFPNRDQHIPFDLMHLLRPQLGDRSRLEDDQGAFLDAMLLAQDNLWLFYNGFDVSDGEVREPSSVLQELINHLALISQPQTQANAQPLSTAAHAAQHGANDANQVDQMVSINGIEVPVQIQQLYRVHPLQPFDPAGFVATGLNRYQDQWFQVALQLRQQNALSQREPWANVEHPIEQEAVTVLDAGQWIHDVTFPARLYLKSLGVQNLRAEDIPALSEPLLLDGLSRYNIRHFLHQQDDEQAQAADVDLLQDQLPVGKVRHSAWQISLVEQQSLAQRLALYATAVTPTTMRQWRIEPTVNMNVRLPTEATSLWVSVDASSARAKRRAKVWLEYLLWLSYANFSDEQALQLQRIAIFSDATIINTGLTSVQAKAYLADWFTAYAYAQQQPLVLPAALLLHLAETGKTLEWESDAFGQNSLSNFADLLKVWNADAAKFMSSFSVEDNEATKFHRDWQFILQEQDATALLNSACAQFAYTLYQPIYQYQSVAEE